MNMMTTIGRGSDLRIDALRAEFGAVLAERIIEAEALDFMWEARVRERYLGEQIGGDSNDEDASRKLSRVAVLSLLDGCWYVGMCLVDGEGAAVELLWKRRFGSREEAEYEVLGAR